MTKAQRQRAIDRLREYQDHRDFWQARGDAEAAAQWQTCISAYSEALHDVTSPRTARRLFSEAMNRVTVTR